MKSLWRLNGYLIKYRRYLLTGVLFIILSNTFSIIPAQIIRHSLDLITESIQLNLLLGEFSLKQSAEETFYQSIFIYGVLILAMALLRGFFLYLTRQTIIVMSRHIEYDQKNEIYNHYQELPLSFYRKNNTGDLMARISEDVGKVRMYVGPAVMYGLNLVVLFVLVISYMISVNPTLALYSLLPLPFLSISVYYVSSRVNKQSEKIQGSLSRLSTFVQEAFSGIRVIKSFVREKDSANQFLNESNKYKDESMSLSRIEALFFPLIMSLVGLSTVTTVYVGSLEVMKGNITVGNIAEFVIYINMLTWPVTSVGWVTSIIQRASASQTRINEFLDSKNDIVSEKNYTHPIKGSIQFENVTFVYPDTGITAIANLSFVIESGQTVAILGNTGSGKSSLANLICRMYDPTQGRVLVDGYDVKDFNPGYLREQIGYVPQDTFLFSDTIKNNIAFGKDDATLQQIETAARQADVYENIQEFPDKFDTVVGERGITLSGGQKQRVTLARALIKDPSILILDDSLSAVDTKTENSILHHLSTIMKDKTSIIISHRVSSVKLADKILVLEKGELVQEGTHDVLMAQEGVYKSLYTMQLDTEK